MEFLRRLLGVSIPLTENRGGMMFPIGSGRRYEDEALQSGPQGPVPLNADVGNFRGFANRGNPQVNPNGMVYGYDAQGGPSNMESRIPLQGAGDAYPVFQNAPGGGNPMGINSFYNGPIHLQQNPDALRRLLRY